MHGKGYHLVLLIMQRLVKHRYEKEAEIDAATEEHTAIHTLAAKLSDLMKF